MAKILNKKMTDQESVLNLIIDNKMETISFDKLLLKTAFCCMASDGNIDKREIALIKTMCSNSPLFKDFNFQEEINSLVNKINTRGKEFISYYFDLLKIFWQYSRTLNSFQKKTLFLILSWKKSQANIQKLLNCLNLI